MLSPAEQKFVNRYKKELYPKRKYILAQGIAFGMLMLFFQWINKFIFDRELFVFRHLLVEIIVWLCGGLSYGWIMHTFLSKRLKKLEKKLQA